MINITFFYRNCVQNVLNEFCYAMSSMLILNMKFFKMFCLKLIFLAALILALCKTNRIFVQVFIFSLCLFVFGAILAKFTCIFCKTHRKYDWDTSKFFAIMAIYREIYWNKRFSWILSLVTVTDHLQCWYFLSYCSKTK